MLPREYRLADRKAITLIFREGRTDANRAVAIRWRKIGEDSTRFAVVAPKKYFPRAVERNRAKRILREAIRFYLPRVEHGHEAVVFYRFRPERLELASLCEYLGALLQKHNFIDR